MKRTFGNKPNKEECVYMLDKSERSKCLELMKQNRSYSIPIENGFEVYIANEDGTQGILSRVINGVQRFLIGEKWI